MPFVSPKSNRGPVTMSKDVLLSCIALMVFVLHVKGDTQVRTWKWLVNTSWPRSPQHACDMCMASTCLRHPFSITVLYKGQHAHQTQTKTVRSSSICKRSVKTRYISLRGQECEYEETQRGFESVRSLEPLPRDGSQQKGELVFLVHRTASRRFVFSMRF